jgi:hypothetical protein
MERPTYTKGNANISCTELLNSPRIVQLKRKHWESIEQDVSEMVWALFGSAVHNILEHGKDAHHLVEQRLFAETDGWKISGAIDLQEVEEDGIIISDYKVTGAWSVMNEKDDWHNQLNVYAWLVEKVKKEPVKKLQIIAIIRDWAARDAEKEGYPSAPVATIDIPLWPMEKRQQYVEDRIRMHSEAYFESETEGDIPPCTPQDMWEKPTMYAVKKEGGVRAKSVHKTKEDAEAALPEKGHFIEIREGERTRCEKYCQVNSFCSQYQNYLKEKNGT